MVESRQRGGEFAGIPPKRSDENLTATSSIPFTIFVPFCGYDDDRAVVQSAEGEKSRHNVEIALVVFPSVRAIMP